MNEHQRDILRHLQRHPDSSVDRIARATCGASDGTTTSKVRGLLVDLESKGRVCRRGGPRAAWLWSATGPAPRVTPNSYRECVWCGQRKLLEDYHRSAKGPCGRDVRCKTCVNNRNRKSRGMVAHYGPRPEHDSRTRFRMEQAQRQKERERDQQMNAEAYAALRAQTEEVRPA